MTTHGADAEQRLRELATRLNRSHAAGDLAKATAAFAGADALALLKALPEWDYQGNCAFAYTHNCGAEDGTGYEHTAGCPRELINALLQRLT